MTNSHYFIVIEGLDGSGKTEMAWRLTDSINRANNYACDTKLTFEPHEGYCGGIFIRHVLMKKIKKDPRTLALIFAANRLDHCKRELEPFLENGSKRKIIISDRYYLSSLVYQVDEDISMEDIMKLNEQAITPDLIIFLNADNSICYERMKKRGQEKELFEYNLNKTRQAYLSAIEFLRKRNITIEIIDANKTKIEVLDNILKAIAKNSPEWVISQYPLPIDEKPEMTTITDVPSFTLNSYAENIQIKPYTSISPSNILEIANEIFITIREKIENEDINTLCLLFLALLKYKGFKINEKNKLVGVTAFDLEFALPFQNFSNGQNSKEKTNNFCLKGVAIILDEGIKQDIILKKLSQISTPIDFLIIYSPRLIGGDSVAFQREANIDKFSPSPISISNNDLTNYIFLSYLDIFEHEYLETMNSFPQIKEILQGFLIENGILINSPLE